MNATNKQGHVWTGEREREWWNYLDDNGQEYQSREVPSYRIVMDKAVMTKHGITPITALEQ
jgi:hypothetical protein